MYQKLNQLLTDCTLQLIVMYVCMCNFFLHSEYGSTCSDANFLDLLQYIAIAIQFAMPILRSSDEYGVTLVHTSLYL